ncbi:hypothetical protein [Hyphobacterium sp.]|uniref:hypothetical protein n=1 Tax=Hyphobacterium sp. TaxID=2004662 RepID=UPI0037481D26
MKEKPKPEKKSESLEIRVAPHEKAAFLQACRNLGLTASNVLRQSMRAFVLRQTNLLPRKGIAMITTALIGVFGWVMLGSYQAGAAPINTDVDLQFHYVDESGTLSRRRMSAQLDMELGETVSMYVNDDGPLSIASFFDAPESMEGSRIRIDLTARAASVDDQVTYNAILRLIGADGEFVGEPIEPELTVKYGSQAEIVIGFEVFGASDEMLEISLQPNVR